MSYHNGKALDDTLAAALLRPSPFRRHLEIPTIFSYVDAVARHGSIRRAAEALHIASSALNRRILDLEVQVGTPLFERLPRGVRATAAGELFLAFVRRSMKEMQILEAQISELRGLGRGHVRIAVAESVIGGLLPEAISAFQKAHPRVCFSVTVDGHRSLSSLLLRDSVDLILTHEWTEHADIGAVASVPQRVCALVAPDHPLAERASLRLSECLDFPIAAPDETLAVRTLLDTACERASLNLEPALIANSVEMTKTFARANQGVCFSFEIGVRSTDCDMVAIPLIDPDLAHGRLCLAVRKGRALSVAAAAFTEQLAEIFQAL